MKLSGSFSEWKHSLVSRRQPPCQDGGVASVAGPGLGGAVGASIRSVLLGVQKVMGRHGHAVAANEEGTMDSCTLHRA